MRLFIAEKPALGKVIADALGGGVSGRGFITCGNNKVTWCVGHLLELVNPEEINPDYKYWVKTDLPLKLRPHKLKPIARTEDQFNVVAGLIKQASEIVHAGDPDDEGQLLVDEVLEYCHNTAPVKRVLINDLNTNAAKKALEKLRDNTEFRGLYQKALARSVADQLYGFNMTRAYTLAAREKGFSGVLSVGRVQTVIQALIVNRYLLNKSHSASFFYDVLGMVSIDGKAIKAKLNIDAEKGWTLDDKGRLSDKNTAVGIQSQIRGKPLSVLDIKDAEKTTSAPLPFSLLKLQVKMSNQWGISSERTLEITQDLREKFKAITYNRSDCSYLSTEQFSEAPDVVAKLVGTISDYGQLQLSGDIDTNRKSRAFNDDEVGAHTAIIPTKSVPPKEKLSADEWKVYDAIATQYLIQFMPEKRYQTLSVEFECGGLTLSAKASKILQEGWTACLKDQEEEEDSGQAETPFDVLQSLSIGQAGKLGDVTVNEEKTKPPALYTEASLLEDLQRVAKYVTDPRIKQLLISKDAGIKGENGGIGTPATRASMFGKLLSRGFYTVVKKKLIPTELGISFIQQLPEIATAPDMTALWHEQQLMIEKGELTVDAFLDEIEIFIAEQVASADVAGMKSLTHDCECGGHYRLRKGERGSFWGCSNYPQCSKTAPDKNGRPDFSVREKVELSSSCPRCKSRMAITSVMYACTGCDFRLYAEYFHKKLTINQVDTLLSKGRTGVIKGFKKNAGGTFEAALVLNQETWRAEPDFKPAPAAAKPKSKVFKAKSFR